jgi:hypothetical protein
MPTDPNHSPQTNPTFNTRRRSKRTVQEAFQNDRWTTDIIGDLPPDGYLQYGQLCMIILDLNRTRNPEDQVIFSWPCDALGNFLAI